MATGCDTLVVYLIHRGSVNVYESLALVAGGIFVSVRALNFAIRAPRVRNSRLLYEWHRSATAPFLHEVLQYIRTLPEEERESWRRSAIAALFELSFRVGASGPFASASLEEVPDSERWDSLELEKVRALFHALFSLHLTTATMLASAPTRRDRILLMSRLEQIPSIKDGELDIARLNGAFLASNTHVTSSMVHSLALSTVRGGIPNLDSALDFAAENGGIDDVEIAAALPEEFHKQSWEAASYSKALLVQSVMNAKLVEQGAAADKRSNHVEWAYRLLTGIR